MRGIKIPQYEFALKMQGGLMREGGRICGTLRYIKSQFNSLVWGSLTLAPIKFHVQFNTSLLASNSRFSFQILF